MSEAMSEAPRADAAADTGRYRFLHTMIRVRDLDKSIDFYTRLLGMKLLRKREFPKGEFTLAFLAYGDEEGNTALELTYNWGETDGYDLGAGFGHLAIGVPDVVATCEQMAAEGIKIPKPPAPMKFGNSSRPMAFIEDPDGYKIELIERP